MPFQIQAKPKPEQRFLDRLDGFDSTVPQEKGADKDRTFVVIRHADGNDELAVEQILTPTEFLYDMGDVGPVRERHLPSQYMLYARRAFLVLVECNILGESGDPLFTKGMSWQDFLGAWAQLPAQARGEMVAQVIAVNPHWGN